MLWTVFCTWREPSKIIIKKSLIHGATHYFDYGISKYLNQTILFSVFTEYKLIAVSHETWMLENSGRTWKEQRYSQKLIWAKPVLVWMNSWCSLDLPYGMTVSKLSLFSLFDKSSFFPKQYLQKKNEQKCTFFRIIVQNVVYFLSITAYSCQFQARAVWTLKSPTWWRKIERKFWENWRSCTHGKVVLNTHLEWESSLSYWRVRRWAIGGGVFVAWIQNLTLHCSHSLTV